MTLFDDCDAGAADPGPPSEADVAAGVLDYLDGEYAGVLDWLRRALVKIYRFRVADVGYAGAYVTADDARRILPRCPFDVPACKNFMGAVFQGKDAAGRRLWQFTGERSKSETPGSHGNELKRWRYTGSLMDGGPLGKDIPRQEKQAGGDGGA